MFCYVDADEMKRIFWSYVLFFFHPKLSVSSQHLQHAVISIEFLVVLEEHLVLFKTASGGIELAPES